MIKAVAVVPVWIRAVLVSLSIPAMWAMELWIGLLLIRTPEVIVGDDPNVLGFISTSAFSVALGLALIWVTLKTPFEVLSLAFYPPGGHRTEKEEYSSE